MYTLTIEYLSCNIKKNISIVVATTGNVFECSTRIPGIDFLPDYLNQSSSLYKEFVNNFTTEVMKNLLVEYQSLIAAQQMMLVVRAVRSGSVIVDFDLVTDSAVNLSTSAVRMSVIKALNASTFGVDLNSTYVKGAVVNAINVENVTSQVITVSWIGINLDQLTQYTVKLVSQSSSIQNETSVTQAVFLNLTPATMYTLTIEYLSCNIKKNISVVVATTGNVYECSTRIPGIDFLPDYLNQSSSLYKEFVNNFTTEVMKNLLVEYQSLIAAQQMMLVVRAVRSGSVIVDFDLVTDSAVNLSTSAVRMSVIKALNASTFGVDLNATYVKGAVVNAINVENVTSQVITVSWIGINLDQLTQYTVKLVSQSSSIQNETSVTQAVFLNLTPATMYTLTIEYLSCNIKKNISVVVATTGNVYECSTRIPGMAFLPDYSNQSSSLYKEFVNNFTTEVMKNLLVEYQSLIAAQQMMLVVRAVRSGSVIVDFDLVTDSAVNLSTSAVRMSVIKALNASTFGVDLNATYVKGAVVNAINVENVTSQVITVSWIGINLDQLTQYTVKLVSQSSSIQNETSVTQAVFLNLTPATMYTLTIEYLSCNIKKNISVVVATTGNVYECSTRIPGMAFLPDYSNQSSSLYKEFVNNFTTEVMKNLLVEYQSLIAAQQMMLVVRAVRSGSVIVDFDLVTDSAVNLSTSAVRMSVIKALNASTFGVDLNATYVKGF
ncbi:hypothetical protein DPEC_G00245170 [Dallia pectoralis]|uniref:Uncharacterized protein n=1 Tax=Dallia pectoralis TaxID=75939 RepID=A0ACC2FVY1_DALPE|nr:hypothetical protein DPEC_G00245170 [Dallia pectoralis]